MLFKLFVVVLLLVVVLGLFSRLFPPLPVRDRAVGRRTIAKLTTRIAIALLLFAIVVLGYHWGWHAPGLSR